MINQSIINKLFSSIDEQYLSFSESEQNEFRKKTRKHNRNKIDLFLFKELFKITIHNSDDINHWLMKLTDKQQDIYNEYLTWIYGIGKDKIFINSGIDMDDSSLDSIHKYDQLNFAYQQESNKKEFPEFYKEKPYRLYMYPTWVRLIIDNELKYATFVSLSRYVADHIDIECQDLIFELIPFRRVKGEKHGEKVGDLTRYDMRYDACGLEDQLSKLKKKASNYLLNLIDVLDDEFHNMESPFVFMSDAKYQQNAINVVFSNEAAIKDLHWGTFMDDISKIKMSNESLIKNIIDDKIEQMTVFINNAYSEIVN